MWFKSSLSTSSIYFCLQLSPLDLGVCAGLLVPKDTKRLLFWVLGSRSQAGGCKRTSGGGGAFRQKAIGERSPPPTPTTPAPHTPGAG